LADELLPSFMVATSLPDDNKTGLTATPVRQLQGAGWEITSAMAKSGLVTKYYRLNNHLIFYTLTLSWASAQRSPQ
jgi:hypothetical protein